MKIVLGYILSVAGKALFYVLIHYVQTNVNYLPLKYPQNQEQQSMGGSHADPKEYRANKVPQLEETTESEQNKHTQKNK